MLRGRAIKLSLFSIFLTFLFVFTLFRYVPTREYYLDPWTGEKFGQGGVDEAASDPLYRVNRPQAELGRTEQIDKSNFEPNVVTGKVIMAELGNATAKAELGRATWRLLHTMTLRYPEHPTHDEREALKNYFYLTSRLYPCGECASHFQKLLKEYPPQTATRKTASLWLCHIHNLVNIRLKKPEFDCGKLDTTYDCGCGPNNTTSSHLSSTSNPNSAPTIIPKSDTKDVKVEDGSSPRGEPVRKDEITGVDMIRGGVRKREQDGQ